MSDYPCPECGYEGAHSWVSRNPETGGQTHECGDCFVEFEIPEAPTVPVASSPVGGEQP